MKRIAILTTLLASGLYGNAQLAVVTSADVTICQPQPVTLTATAPSVPSTSAYSVASIPWAPEPIGGTIINLSDDAVSGVQPIGFTFCFLGQSYSQFYIGSNGWISFSAGQPNTYTSATVPSTIASVPKNCIMGPWQDWHPGIAPGNYIKYQTIGTAPFRKLVVTYDNVPMYQCTTTYGRFQIVCHETTNTIENHIFNKPFCSWAGGGATQAIHNATGTIAYVVPGRNSSVWTAVNESWRYSPSGPSGNIVWTTGGQNVGSGTSITVNPTQTTTYTASLDQCGSQVTPGQVTVSVAPSPLNSQNPFTLTPTSCTEAVGNISLNFNPNMTDPISILWNDVNGTTVATLENIPSGTYGVQITNLITNCVTTQSFNPTFPQPLSLNASSQDETCTGQGNGQVSVTTVGGSTPFQYFWEELEANQAIVNGVGPGNYTINVIDANNCLATATVNVTTLVDLDLVPFSSNITCAGLADGIAGVNVTGGQPNYTYQWNDPQGQTSASISGLQAGTYTVLVTEGSGCSGSASIEIAEPQVLVASVSSATDALCFGQSTGQASINVSGGTTPFLFTYNGNIQDNPTTTLGAGTYTVVVTDASGCSVNTSVTIGQPPLLTAMVAGVNPLCFGGTTGSATASAQGGTGNYSYSWTNSTSTTATAANLPSGSYTATVTDANGCSATASVSLTQPTAVVGIITTTPATCGLEDGSATVAASGGNGPYSYNWQNLGQSEATATELGAGSYQVVITDANGCTGNSTTSVIETDFPDAEIWADPVIGFAPLVVNFQNESSNATSYEWDFGDGATLTTTNNSEVNHTFNANGALIEFEVTVTAVNDGGCSDTFSMIIQVFGLSSLETFNYFSPNGDQSGDVFRFETRSMRELECTIFNRWGKEVYKWKGADGGWDGRDTNGGDCPTGAYFYIVKATGFDGKAYDIQGYVTLGR